MQNPISRTAYYTLSVRAWDATQPKPLCGDRFAERLVNEDSRKLWEEVKHLSGPNSSIAVRHRIIDEHLRDELENSPDSTVFVIGAGFDTRAFRHKGGKWIEVDEPAVIEYKERRLPATECPNPLTRIPIEFSKETLADRLSDLAASGQTHIVVEGVLMYLTQSQRLEMIETLKTLFPRHYLYCDLMNRPFFDKYSRKIHEKIAGLGASFQDIVEEPEKLFTDAGYIVVDSTSIPLRGAELGAGPVPYFLIRWFLGTLRRGYSIWKFAFERQPESFQHS
jgi:methyltransferase (TIGR00027 family)